MWSQSRVLVLVCCVSIQGMAQGWLLLCKTWALSVLPAPGSKLGLFNELGLVLFAVFYFCSTSNVHGMVIPGLRALGCVGCRAGAAEGESSRLSSEWLKKLLLFYQYR